MSVVAPNSDVGLILYKIWLNDGRRPNPDVQDFNLDGRNVLEAVL